MGRRPKITREDVLRAARETFSERGFEGATLAAIAARLDVSPAALLRHAATKEELFAAAMAQPAEFVVPVTFLAEVDGAADPEPVLRRFAEVFVPFIEKKFEEQIARWMRAKSDEIRGLPLPFDLDARPTPPQRVLALLEGYFRRAGEAGTVRVSDPLAAALAFLAELQAYVVLHKIVRILEPPLPLDRYLDTVFEIWTHGAFAAPDASPVPGEPHEAQDHPGSAAARRGGSRHLVVPDAPGEGGGADPLGLDRSPDGGGGVPGRGARRRRPR
ncbi:MAG TPA: helix-turn-helix domain-containing protein [Thermoanaerobaculia bacterium]|nr:helix-turn-helix domain-containing protein [Thermoanaerobaculia bacterium]